MPLETETGRVQEARQWRADGKQRWRAWLWRRQGGSAVPCEAAQSSLTVVVNNSAAVAGEVLRRAKEITSAIYSEIPVEVNWGAAHSGVVTPVPVRSGTIGISLGNQGDASR